MRSVLYVVTAVSVAIGVSMGINRIVQWIPRLVRQSIIRALPLSYPLCWEAFPFRDSLSRFCVFIFRRKRHDKQQ